MQISKIKIFFYGLSEAGKKLHVPDILCLHLQRIFEDMEVFRV